jgi:cytochrome P450
MNMRAGDVFVVHIKGLHHNPTEWQRPNEFLPKRWQFNNPLSLTPSGTKRDSMSFVPFTGGKRICFGKTFAEISGRIVITMLINAFKFEFIEQRFMTEFPHFSVMATKDVDVYVRLTP